MNKIDKLDKELEKAREKAAEWQAKIRELEKQKQEEENSQIVQAVRSLKLSPQLPNNGSKTTSKKGSLPSHRASANFSSKSAIQPKPDLLL